MEDKWTKLRGKGYRLVNLGRPAVFLLPSHKLLNINDADGRPIGEALHQFLMQEFGGYTSTLLPYFGVWKDAGQACYDECRRYEVAFNGIERIPILIKKLAEVALLIDEDCIYFQAGQYACLIYPD